MLFSYPSKGAEFLVPRHLKGKICKCLENCHNKFITNFLAGHIIIIVKICPAKY